jgi:hypothetical protein
MRHEAVFELEEPMEFPQGAILEFRLEQFERGHSLGRLRLSVTSARPPLPVTKLSVDHVRRGEVPRTKTGGLLAVSVELRQGQHPYWTHHRPGTFEVMGTLNGQSAGFKPVVGDGWYPAPWQTWRLEVEPSELPQPFELRVTSDLPTEVEHRFSAHFVPR